MSKLPLKHWISHCNSFKTFLKYNKSGEKKKKKKEADDKALTDCMKTSSTLIQMNK